MITIALGVAALIGWFGLELVVRRPGAASALVRTDQDRLSTPLLVAAYAICGVVSVLLDAAGVGTLGDAAWIGVALAAAGLAIRAWAMATLRGAYSRTLRTTSDQQLVSTGPYRWIRHPGYAGSLLVWVGAAIAFHSWLAALLVAVLMLLAYGWRIRSEERMLVEHFGDAYRDYRSRTSRLIPGIY